MPSVERSLLERGVLGVFHERRMWRREARVIGTYTPTYRGDEGAAGVSSIQPVGWRLAAEHPDRITRYVAMSVGAPPARINELLLGFLRK